MDISIFLARVLGLYLVIVSLGLLVNRNRYNEMITDIIDRPALQLILGLNILIMGILLILVHNMWESSWRVIITITAWLIFIKGVLNVVFPQVANQAAKSYLQCRYTQFLSIGINLALGLFLIYMGWF